MGKLLKSCMLGDKKACTALKLRIFGATTVSFSAVQKLNPDHPNQMPFKGVLLVTDEASTKPPHGSRGHRILVPASVARKRLSGLVGQGVNYDPVDLNEHMPNRKVGVVTKAWMEGNQVWVSGLIWAKDFPNAKQDLKRGDLGMSMELADVYVEDEHSLIWNLLDFQFTGCTILKRNAAAYFKTSLAASKAAAREGEPMKTQKKQVAAAGEPKITVEALAAAIQKANEPIILAVNGLNSRMTSFTNKLDELGSIAIQGAGTALDEEDDISAGEDDIDASEDVEAGDDVDAAKKDEEDDGDEDDDDNADDVDAEIEELGPEKPAHADPGQVNKNAPKNKGRKTTTTDVGAEAVGGKPFPGLVKGEGVKASSLTMTAAAARINTLSAAYRKAERTHKLEIAAAAKENRKLALRLEKIQAQVELFAEQESRRSVIPIELSNLAAKANVDLYAVRNEGMQMSTQQVDDMLASGGDNLDPVTKMAMKNRLSEMGLFNVGQIER